MQSNAQTCVILLGGDAHPTERLKRQTHHGNSMVIAADGGMRHAEALELKPEIWLGDFDSTPSTMDVGSFTGHVETHQTDKAQTDGALAIDKALSLGATRLVLVGALGGERSDHMMMHMSQALALAAKGVDILLTSGTEEAIPLIADNHAITIKPDWPKNTIFSLVGYTDLEGVSLNGMKWPLAQHHVPFGETLTLSNEITGTAEITLEKGRAMALVHFMLNMEKTS